MHCVVVYVCVVVLFHFYPNRYIKYTYIYIAVYCILVNFSWFN